MSWGTPSVWEVLLPGRSPGPTRKQGQGWALVLRAQVWSSFLLVAEPQHLTRPSDRSSDSRGGRARLQEQRWEEPVEPASVWLCLPGEGDGCHCLQGSEEGGAARAGRGAGSPWAPLSQGKEPSLG